MTVESLLKVIEEGATVPLRAKKYKWNHDKCFCSQCCPGKWRNEND